MTVGGAHERQQLAVCVIYPDHRAVVGPVDWLDHRLIGGHGMFIVRPVVDIGWMRKGLSYGVNYSVKETAADPLSVLPIAFQWACPLLPDATNPLGYRYDDEAPVDRDGFEYWVNLYPSREALEARFRRTAERFPHARWESVF